MLFMWKESVKMEKQGYHVAFVTILLNILLTALKLIAGIIGASSSMISDAIHSASDVLSTLIVVIGIYIANKKSDRNHPYGHEKFESLAAIILALLLAYVGIEIGLTSIGKISSGESLSTPGFIALIAALVSIVIKEWMYQYTKAVARKINSTAMLADAWHHRSDALSSIGAFVGILASMLGYPIFDLIASIIISLFIIKVAYDTLKDALDKMLDTACNIETENTIRELVLANKMVLSIDDLKTRLFGSKIYVDLEIGLDSNLTLIEAHNIAEKIHNIIENKIAGCKHCMVHVNPKEK